MATKKPRYMISVDNDMFNAIEDFRFERRFQTRSEATTELIRLGLEQLKKEEAAAKEGYQEGLQTAQEDLERVKESLSAFFNAKQEIYDNIAPDILEISLDIAKKIIKKESIENPDVILNNIKDIMKGLSKEEAKITLRVNPSQAAMLKNDVPEVADSLGLEAKIIIVADETITEGGCLVTTTNGVIDATIESQLAIISEVLKEI